MRNSDVKLLSSFSFSPLFYWLVLSKHVCPFKVWNDFWYYFVAKDLSLGPPATLYSWKAYVLDHRNGSYANKMVVLKVPVVHYTVQTAAKLKEMTAVNKEGVLVLSPGVVESLASWGLQTTLCFLKLKKNQIGTSSYQSLLQYRRHYGDWETHALTARSNRFKSPFSVLSPPRKGIFRLIFTITTKDYYPTVCIVLQS